MTEYIDINAENTFPYNLIQEVLITETVKAIAGITIKELLKKITDSAKKEKLKDFFKDFNAPDDAIVVDLKKNPGLYTALSSKELYNDIVIREVNGMIIVKPPAQAMINSYGRDETFFEYRLLDRSLNAVFANSSWGIVDVLVCASKLTPSTMDQVSWSTKLATNAAEYKATQSQLSNRFKELVDCRVRLDNFERFVDLLLKDASTLLRSGVQSYTEVLEQTQLRAFKDRKYPLVAYSLLTNSAITLNRLLSKWNIDSDLLFIDIGPLLSVLIESCNQK